MTLLSTRLPRPRDVSHEFGIYVHVPFCSHRCWYCDFNAYSGLEHTADAYMEALAADVRGGLSAPADTDLAVRPTVTSIFIGGGTPTLVDAASIARVVQAVRDSWPLDPGAEVTIECNPETLTAEKLETYLACGINRVSIGVQSLDAELLARLGRTHSAQTAVDALVLARRCGFDNVSGDLIFGVPGETDETWRASVEGVLATGVEHMSCYALTYEEGTPLESWRKLGKIVPVDDDEVADRWEIADSLLSRAGLARYEISNWGASRSRHNSLYWATGEYLGVGAGAHSHLATHDGATRSWTVKGPERYTRAVAEGIRPIAGSEDVDEKTRAAEAMILGLRRTDGVAEADFEGVVGRPIDEVFSEELSTGVAKGLLERTGGRVRLLKPLLANQATILFA